MKKSPSKACQETADSLSLGTSDEIRAERARLHLKHCQACQQDERTMGELRHVVRSADDRLDDMTRARVQGQLAEAMEQASRQAESKARAGGIPGMKLALAVAAAGLLVAAAALLWKGTPAPAPAPTEQLAVEKKTAPMQNNHVLQPRAMLKGAELWPASSPKLGEKVARLQLPAGVELSASLAQGAEITLYGPLDLRVKEAGDKHTELKLAVGSMVVDYDGDGSKLLRIVSPGVITEVIGTLFSVQVSDGQTLVSVARGKVKVRSAGATLEVVAGQTWSTSERKLGATPASSAALLARHGANKAATVAELAPPLPNPKPTAKPRPVGEGLAPSREAARTSPTTSGAAARTSPTEKTDKNQPPTKPAQETQPPASALYARAEAALGRGDQAGARKSLARIIEAHPAEPLADSARYELALLRVKAGQTQQAEEALAGIKGSKLAEPAHMLGCRIKQNRGDRQAAIACYRAFRKRFPASPHNARTLETIIDLVGQK